MNYPCKRTLHRDVVILPITPYTLFRHPMLLFTLKEVNRMLSPKSTGYFYGTRIFADYKRG